MTARNVAFSRTRLTELMVPSFANFGGKVHGGVILSLMDKSPMPAQVNTQEPIV